MFQIRTSIPPGRSTLCNSGSAVSWSNQWKAWATVIASADASASGSDSAVPSSASAPGDVSASFARISATGSTATTRAPVGTSSRVSFPVPAARSTTTRPGPSPASAAIQSTASAGYDGRARS